MESRVLQGRQNQGTIADAIGTSSSAEATAGGEQRRKILLLHVSFWVAAALIGALQAWSARHDMNADGVSYLDMADAYMKGEWHTALNGYWSPLYAWLLGVAIHVVKPSAFWEYPLVHFVNFAIYMVSLGCFTFLLAEIIRYKHHLDALLSRDTLLPDWSWLVMGYSLFVWSSIQLVNLSLVTPDLCVAAFVYLAAALIIRIKRKGAHFHLSLFVALGLVLGFAYLAKAAMFPLAFVFLAVSVSFINNVRRSVQALAAALVAFCLVALPFIWALSLTKSRLTIGDAGKLTYALLVNGTTVRHWQGDPLNDVFPKHTSRSIFREPTVYEFDRPMNVTYAPWYDQSYWFEGLRVRFSLTKQFMALKARLQQYLEMYFQQERVLIGLLIGSTILNWMAWTNQKLLRNVSIHWQLIIPAIAAFGMYALVYVEPRYIAPFAVLFWLGTLAAVVLPEFLKSTKLVLAVSAVIFALTAIKILVPTIAMAQATAREVLKPSDEATTEIWRIAAGLHDIGVRDGDHVAVIGWGSEEARWARLARVRIVAEISESPASGFLDGAEFWRAPDAVKSNVYDALARIGARAIVARVPDYVSADGWQRIGNTTYSAHWLP